MSNRFFNLLLELVAWLVAFAQISMAQYGYPADIPTNNTANSNHLSSTFNPSANVTFYIDTNSYPPGSPMYNVVFEAASSWGAYQYSQGGTACEPTSQKARCGAPTVASLPVCLPYLNLWLQLQLRTDH